MINLCLVVIATQFSETKQRESQLMKEQRVRFLSGVDVSEISMDDWAAANDAFRPVWFG